MVVSENLIGDSLTDHPCGIFPFRNMCSCHELSLINIIIIIIIISQQFMFLLSSYPMQTAMSLVISLLETLEF